MWTRRYEHTALTLAPGMRCLMTAVNYTHYLGHGATCCITKSKDERLSDHILIHFHCSHLLYLSQQTKVHIVAISFLHVIVFVALYQTKQSVNQCHAIQRLHTSSDHRSSRAYM